MKPGTGPRTALLALGVALTVVVTGILFIGTHSLTVQWEVALTPDCQTSLEHSFPSGVQIAVQWTPSAPPFSPGGIWVNESGPTSSQWVRGYLDTYVSQQQTDLSGFVSEGGEYAFLACAVGGSPVFPVFLNATYETMG